MLSVSPGKLFLMSISSGIWSGTSLMQVLIRLNIIVLNCLTLRPEGRPVNRDYPCGVYKCIGIIGDKLIFRIIKFKADSPVRIPLNNAAQDYFLPCFKVFFRKGWLNHFPLTRPLPSDTVNSNNFILRLGSFITSAAITLPMTVSSRPYSRALIF